MLRELTATNAAKDDLHRKSEIVELTNGKPFKIKQLVKHPDGVFSMLRDEAIDEQQLVLIRFGKGTLQDVATRMLRAYYSYGEFSNEDGLLCLSVFGLEHGVSIEDIDAALSNEVYRVAKYSDVVKIYKLILPITRISNTDSDELKIIQRSHYDIVISGIDTKALQGKTYDILSNSVKKAIRKDLASALAILLDLFKTTDFTRKSKS